MSNIKLYTEDQVKQILLKNSCFCYPDPDIDKVLSELKTIELPTNEEIEEIVLYSSEQYTLGFKDAIDYLKNKINT